MINFMSQCIELMEQKNKMALHELLSELHAQDELRFIQAEDPDFYDEVLEVMNG